MVDLEEGHLPSGPCLVGGRGPSRASDPLGSWRCAPPPSGVLGASAGAAAAGGDLDLDFLGAAGRGDLEFLGAAGAAAGRLFIRGALGN